MSKSLELLEARQLFAVLTPTDLDAKITYRNAPDGAADRATLIWTDTNTTETGYRVEQSPDGLTNWSVAGPDLDANSTTAFYVLNAGQKLHYRVFAVAGSAVSAPSNVATPITPLDRAVQVSATVSGDAVTIRWPHDPDAVSYKVYRKSRLGSAWYLRTPSPLDGDTMGFSDTLARGQAYEYQVERVTRNFYGTLDGNAYGYVYAGNRFVSNDKRGRVLLVVDQSRASAISQELTRYRRDLLADGWTVQQITVPRDNGDARQATVIKALIQAAAIGQPSDPLKSIVLIGHVPVPYSGTTAWDGHPDHAGAWPADSYYGEAIGINVEPGIWTDTGLTPNFTNPDNNNWPGDGKFDQDTLPGTVTVPVGRIDFANLPGMVWSFNPVAPNADAGENLLLKRYFDKNHAWRTREIVVSRTAIHDDHLGGSAAENGWRNFAPLVGATQTVSADWVTTMGDTTNLWSAGLGPGGVEYASGIVDVHRLHTPNANVLSVFNLLTGSWFGDWNKSSNLMREIVAANGTSLAAIWTGTPNVYLHTMGLGETIGQGMMLSQNNSFTGPYLPASTGSRAAHLGLIGDPTLTQLIVPPVTNIASTRASNINTISWTAPTDSNVTGFHVYRADTADGPFYRLNSSAIPSVGMNATMSFTDPTQIVSYRKFTYMVRAIKMQLSPSGRYENFSWGQTVQSKTTNSDDPELPTGAIMNPTPQPLAMTTGTAPRMSSAIFADESINRQSDPLDDLGL